MNMFVCTAGHLTKYDGGHINLAEISVEWRKSLLASFRLGDNWQRSLAQSDSVFRCARSLIMARSFPGAPGVSSSSSCKQDSAGREVGNFILRGLPRKECALLLPSLEFVRLKLHQVLHETGEAIKSGYFLNDGLGSVPDGPGRRENCRSRLDRKRRICRHASHLRI